MRVPMYVHIFKRFNRACTENFHVDTQLDAFWLQITNSQAVWLGAPTYNALIFNIFICIYVARLVGTVLYTTPDMWGGIGV